MKTLILVRHAQSGFSGPSERDIDRKLTTTGKRDVTEMAKSLLSKEIIPKAFISSPARRAIQTASIFMETMGLRKEKLQIEPDLYEPVVKSFYNIIKSMPESIDSVIIFSHNPAITLFINELDCQPVFDLPPCGMYAIEIDTKDWDEFQIADKSFLFYEYPEG